MYEAEERSSGLHDPRNGYGGGFKGTSEVGNVTGRLDDAMSMQNQTMAILENLIERIHGSCNPQVEPDKVRPRICLIAQAETVFHQASEIRDRLSFLQSII